MSILLFVIFFYSHLWSILTQELSDDVWLTQIRASEIHFREHGRMIGSLNFAHLMFDVSLGSLSRSVIALCEHQLVMIGNHTNYDDYYDKESPAIPVDFLKELRALEERRCFNLFGDYNNIMTIWLYDKGVDYMLTS